MPFQITETTTGVEIDDANASTTTTYSSNKIESELNNYVTSADAPQLPETTDNHRIVTTTTTENTFEDGLRIYRESNNCINIGDHEESNRSTRDESICIGLSSGCLGNATHQKTCVGYQSARGTSGDQIVCMGVRAFQGSTGSNLTALGHYSMSQCNAGTGSTAVGHYAGQFTTNLTDSVVVGNSAGRNLTGTGLERCVGIGASAFFSAQNTYDTQCIGESAGNDYTGGRSVGIGRQALAGATGDRLIAIGTNALGNGFSVSAFSGSDKFVVGENTSASVTKPYILDCDTGTTDATRVIRLNADDIHVGSSLPTTYDATNPLRIWTKDSILNLGTMSDDVVRRLQDEYSGDTHDYITTTNVSFGQPLEHIYDNVDNKLKIRAYQATPSNNFTFAGVAVQDATSGNVCRVLHHGICPVRRTTVTNTITDYVRDATIEADNTNYGNTTGANLVLLNATTNGTTVSVGNTVATGIRFRDSGNAGDYSANETYNIIFDAGAGNKIAIRFTDFEFEHASTQAYDWLQMRCSDTDSTPNDGDEAIFAFCHTMSTNSTSASNKTFQSNDWQISSGDSQTGGGGYCLPETTTRALLINSDIVAADEKWASTAWFIAPRYMKFIFRSDSSTQEPGWDFELRAISATAGAVDAVIGTQLSVSSVDPTLAEDSSAHPFGVVIHTETDNNRVLALIGHDT